MLGMMPTNEGFKACQNIVFESKYWLIVEIKFLILES